MNNTNFLYSLLVVLCSIGLNYAQAPLPTVDYTNFALHKEFLDQSKTEKDLWAKKEHDCPETVPDAIAALFQGSTKHSQSHLLAMYKGNMRMAIFALAIPEKQYFKASGMTEENFTAVTSCIAGFRPAFELMAAEDIDYFSKITNYLRFVRSIESKPYYYMGRKLSFKLLRKAEDVDALFDNPQQVGGGVQLFGGHLLADYFYLRQNRVDEPLYRKEVLQNVRRLKGSLPLEEHTEDFIDFPILFFTIDSDFRNGLGGDIAAEAKEKDRKIYKEAIPAQEGLSAVGKEVVRLMVDKTAGRRICIDFRGLSFEARRWAYDYYQGLRYHGDTIPVIMANTAVSGQSWNKDAQNPAVSDYFNHAQIRASREDLQAILESKGMLSITLNKRKLVANTKMAEILEAQQMGSANYRETAVKILMANVFRCVQVTQDRDIWDRLSISTGFDGLGSYFDTYKTAGDLRALRKDVLDFLNNPTPIFDLYSEVQIEAFLYDYEPEEIVEKLFSTNARDFTKSLLRNVAAQESSQAQGK